jgi:predicted RNase H-like nuclease (RuvC/YqgF family)
MKSKICPYWRDCPSSGFCESCVMGRAFENLSKKIKNLKAKNEALKAENEELKSKIEILKNPNF